MRTKRVEYDMNLTQTMKSALLLTLLLSAACSTTSIGNSNTRLDDDREVAMIVRVANLSEVREGNVARTRATDPAVRDFAVMMVNEHSNAETKAETDLLKADLAFTDSEVSRKLDAESGAVAESLSQLKGSQFDQAYMDRQIAVHQAVLDTIDKTLLPKARNRHLRDVIKETRTTVQTHLEKAKTIRAALK
jgi:putative membrane protein